MRRQGDHRVEEDTGAGQGLGQDADEELVEPLRGAQEEAPLDAAAADLDEGVFGNPAGQTCHALVNGRGLRDRSRSSE